MTKAEGSDGEERAQLVRLLRRASRSATRVYRELVSELELTPRQAAAIDALVERPGATLNALAEALGADQATASALVDRLLAADLVRRETDPNDRRRAALFPTAKALELAQRLAKARDEADELLHAALGGEDSARLGRVLSRLIKALEDRERLSAGGSSN